MERQENPTNRVQDFLGDESGVTAIEYVLIASLIAVFIVAAVRHELERRVHPRSATR
jgi:Flp pilus assembly pilin Flp